MVPEYNAPGRIRPPRTTEPQAAGRSGRGESADKDLRAPAKAAETTSIDVVFDLDDPAQAQSLERHRAAFGNDYAEVELIGGGKAVLTVRPGGAKRLL
jgi:hypothetical protein